MMAYQNKGLKGVYSSKALTYSDQVGVYLGTKVNPQTYVPVGYKGYGFILP